jgi:hypothetical protein
MVRKRRGDVSMYDEKWRYGQRGEKVFAYWGVWEGARLREMALTAFAYPDAVEFICHR